MSVITDSPTATGSGPARTTGTGRRRRSLPVRSRTALLPPLSLLVFLAVWQLLAASGLWSETFVPYPATVWQAFLDVSANRDYGEARRVIHRITLRGDAPVGVEVLGG